MRKLSPRKPLVLLQTAGISYGGDKNAWLRDYFTEATNYPKLYVIVYYNTVVQGESGYAPGFDWPIYWNDTYQSSAGQVNVNLPQMRWSGWLDAIATNGYLTFSSVPMLLPGNSLSLIGISLVRLPHRKPVRSFTMDRDESGDYDGDGVSNWEELASGLDPLVQDKQSEENDCSDGIDNDANGGPMRRHRFFVVIFLLQKCYAG